jgi:cell division septation protein DedD
MNMSNRQVIAIFFIGIAMLLVAFWAGLKVAKERTAPVTTQTESQGGMHPFASQQMQAKTAGVPLHGQQSGATFYIVRVATFGTAEQADQLTNSLRRIYKSAYTEAPTPGGEDSLYRVNIGPYERREDAEQVANELAAAGRKGLLVIPKTQK